MKVCTKCKVEKELTEFYPHKMGRQGVNSACKVCRLEQQIQTELNNPRGEYRKKRYESNKKEMNRKQNISNMKRYHSRPEVRIIHSVRSRIRNFLNGKSKSKSTLAILGIDGMGYKQYLESLFTEGMNWDNYGEWEIDHIHPVSKGGSFHYKNTQPLWMEENRSKGDKINKN